MREIVGYGIDYGTSNSAVALARASGVDLVPVGAQSGAPTLPSIVYLHREGRREAGEEAPREFFRTGHRRTSCGSCSLAPYGVSECLQFRRGGGCNDSRLLAAVKRDLAKPGFAGTNSWCTDFPVPELVAIVLRRLKAAADAAAGREGRRVVMGHPVVFAGGEGEAAQAEGLRRLRRAAESIGFEEVEFFPEPAAAVLSERAEGVVALSADFGGGTFDAAVMDGRRGEPRVTGLQGTPIGGERLDEVIFETVVGPALALEALPNWLYNDMRSLRGVMLLLADPGIPGILGRVGGQAGQAGNAILFEGRAYEFYKRIEAAKIALSSQEEARLQFFGPGISLDRVVSRGFFEASIAPELDAVEAVLRAALREARVRPEEVGVLLLTGGSSQIPAFRRRVGALLPAARVEQRDAFTSVVKGLGLRARDLWG